MAKYYGYGYDNANYVAVVELTETAHDSAAIAGNYTDISWVFSVYHQNNASTYSRSSGNHFGFTADGSSRSASYTVSTVAIAGHGSEANALVLTRGSFRVYHSSDGTKSFTFSATYYNDNSSSVGSASHPLAVSGTFTCTAIPRASSVSAADITLGTAGTINVARASTSFTHTLTWTVGGSSGTIATGVGDSCSWTPAIADFAPLCTTASTMACTITCTTYSGGSSIGTSTTVITLTIPASAGPSLSITAAPFGRFNAYTQGDYCYITFTDSAQYGASIVSRTVDSAAVTSPHLKSLSSSGSVTFTCAVTDSRGMTASVTRTITVLPYGTPAITSYSAYRCLSNGTASDSGTYIRIYCEASYASVNGLNSLTVTYQYGAGGSLSSPVTISPSTAYVIGGGNVLVTGSYDVYITATDATGAAYQIHAIVPTETVTIHLRHGGKGVGIGTYAQSDEELRVGWTTHLARLKEQGTYAEAPLIATGNIVNDSAGRVTGYGVVTVTKLTGAVVAIDFAMAITSNDLTGTADHVSWGLNRNLIKSLIDSTYSISSPTITPIDGGVITYYRIDGTLYTEAMDQGGTAIAFGNYWLFSRAYNNTSRGGWPSAAFPVDCRMTGRIYGTISI